MGTTTKGKWKMEFDNLFVKIGDQGIDQTLLPIIAIKAVQEEDNAVIVHLKEEYSFGDYPYQMIYSMTLEEIHSKINETIIKALKEVEGDA